MYSYTYDKETGGILLNSSPSGFSKEPRPVYASELDVLGFDKYWKYDKQTDRPYMWAESNYYWYRGNLVAMLKGGNLYTAPEIRLAYACKEYRETPNSKATQKILCESSDKIPSFIDKKGNVFSIVNPEPNGNSLRPVDVAAMVEANHEMLEIIEQTTVKKILAIYEKYKGKLDLFHVAFSGGKDSCVLLDLVKKALPKGSFVVVFGDTGMEFPDTYEVIRKTEQQCLEDKIPFYSAKSHLNPKESWEMFGPPSRTLRWCCSVHKSTPQTLKLREITGKDNYTGLAFVGVRAQESATRAEYEYENYGKKVKGQYDFYPILEWTSAEVFLYSFANDILINDTYKKGISRAGCLICPMSGGLSEHMRRVIYPDAITKYFTLIRNTSDKPFTDSRFSDFMKRGAWKSRADGRFVAGTAKKYHEETRDGKTQIIITNPSSDWKEWIKTLDWDISFSVQQTNSGFKVSVSERDLKSNPSLAKIFRQVFRKAAYCCACTVCAANCRNGCISFENESIKIDGCRHCFDCHNLPGGCLLYDSLKIPNGGIKMRSINSFTEHAPKSEWMIAFFNDKEAFFETNNLGPDQQLKFKVFLADAALSEKNHFSSFAELVSSIGWKTETALGLVLVNLVAANPQMKWYIKNLDIGHIYTRKNVIDMLLVDGLLVRPANAVTKAYKRIVETPLGTILHLGYVTDKGDIARTKCSVSDPRVVLYGLFKFAEKCNDYKEFTLATLLNDNIDRDGISPTRIFGLDRDEMTPILLGLSAKYPEFITASFTHDLEKITLAEDKSSQDVLDLFKEDAAYGQ
ncbi:MAG: phosphoadenosine phosphosulfate reductase family protein [Clostridiaceae bacterium]|nr:phosphoadenosine phosphosulfate reductase family protein [Clostridiaceae bacterium]